MSEKSLLLKILIPTMAGGIAACVAFGVVPEIYRRSNSTPIIQQQTPTQSLTKQTVSLEDEVKKYTVLQHNVTHDDKRKETTISAVLRKAREDGVVGVSFVMVYDENQDALYFVKAATPEKVSTSFPVNRLRDWGADNNIDLIGQNETVSLSQVIATKSYDGKWTAENGFDSTNIQEYGERAQRLYTVLKKVINAEQYRKVPEKKKLPLQDY